MSKIIDGKGIAQQIKDELKIKAVEIKRQGVNPKLVVILVGSDPGSEVYVRNKEKACEEIGIDSQTIRMPADAKEEAIIAEISKLNNDPSVHGILVQLPLPKGRSEHKVLCHINPKKDVDGLHIDNLGRLFKGEPPFFYPCTPMGVMELIKTTGIEIAGKEAVVIGRSNIVGKPMAILLMNANATVTICHSKTQDIGKTISRAEIVVAAIGRPEMIKGDMIKAGAVVIDVGMNRLETGLVGDVEFSSASKKASYITPVPKGVGPMTIAMLLKNTISAAERAL